MSKTIFDSPGWSIWDKQIELGCLRYIKLSECERCVELMAKDNPTSEEAQWLVEFDTLFSEEQAKKNFIDRIGYMHDNPLDNEYKIP